MKVKVIHVMKMSLIILKQQLYMSMKIITMMIFVD